MTTISKGVEFIENFQTRQANENKNSNTNQYMYVHYRHHQHNYNYGHSNRNNSGKQVMRRIKIKAPTLKGHFDP